MKYETTDGIKVFSEVEKNKMKVEVRILNINKHPSLVKKEI